MLCGHDRRHRLAALLVALTALAPRAAAADDWLVYIGGGITPIEGGWTERNGQVIFSRLGGTLVSVPYFEVDLPTSAFITWHLGGRRVPPPRPAIPEAPAEPDGAPEPGCTSARIVALPESETLEVAIGEEREKIHLACLDAPEIGHRFPSLGWFGRAALSAIELEVRPGQEVCLTEHTPPLRDQEGHRILFVTLADGRDYTTEAIAGGLGLVRPGACARAAHYRAIENYAIAQQRGLWGPEATQPAFSAAGNAAATAAGGAPPPRSAGGG